MNNNDKVTILTKSTTDPSKYIYIFRKCNSDSIIKNKKTILDILYTKLLITKKLRNANTYKGFCILFYKKLLPSKIEKHN
ncbi:Hypothetical protein ERGA_CDS_05740 [Ehrlichia ruminantium str. Gardel]|nr:Hypothetical protein ERGA_CDS_05740 [Ehrlichia ruminantium str. Gardel]